MKPSTRIIFNTSIQYVRTVISVLVTLYTARLILDALGVEDYGIYSLVGGIVAMLSFVQTSLTSTTQRYLSFHQGKGDFFMQHKIFNNSIVTQLIISVTLISGLCILQPFIFNGFLNIPADRVNAAIWVYYCMLFTLFFTMQSTPYLAVLIAHENIFYATIVQLTYSFLKIPIALILYAIPVERLKYYAILLVIVQAANYFMYLIYCKRKYKETKNIHLFSLDKQIFKQMFSFMGWSVYSTGCIVGRTQGIAILLNRFFGTVVNAAYGIAWQVSGQLNFLSSSIQNATKPQLIRAEGANDRKKMFRLAEITSKFSFLLLAFMSIPAIMEMDDLLSIWLKEVPENTVVFCQFIVLTNLADQLTIGLAYANEAIGKIRNYSLVVNSIKLLSLPAAFLFLHYGAEVIAVMYCILGIELLCALTRLPFLKFTGGLSIKEFSKRVFLPIIPPFCLTVILCYYYSSIFSSTWSFVGNFIISAITMGISSYFFSLCKDEKEILQRISGIALQKVKSINSIL